MTPYPDRCTACRICELVCSFHHVGLFQPAISSIEIKKQDALGLVEMFIHEAPVDRRLACDWCKGEERPFCVKWCPAGAIGR